MSRAELSCEFRLEAAHRLTGVPEGHKCGRLHGHSFRVEIAVEGQISERQGWVADYAEIAAAFEPLRERLDHHYLNEIEGLENPTAEHLARWIWDRLSPSLPGLCRVTVRETCETSCSYRGPG
ncbi:MAG: 6-carboxytetrahydropterin synthase QueD [Planctomycetota bacterium]